jgi:predicted HTH domain antitoxin
MVQVLLRFNDTLKNIPENFFNISIKAFENQIIAIETINELAQMHVKDCFFPYSPDPTDER